MQANVKNLTYEIVLEPGEKLVLPQIIVDSIGAGRWRLIIEPAEPVPYTDPDDPTNPILNGYASEDEGLYDDLGGDEITPKAAAAIAQGPYAAFLNSYEPEDEGLYDDYPPR